MMGSSMNAGQGYTDKIVRFGELTMFQKYKGLYQATAWFSRTCAPIIVNQSSILHIAARPKSSVLSPAARAQRISSRQAAEGRQALQPEVQ
eukprot:SAG31_NODE_584_length_13886_cov_96.615000_11_plen_91_part_00